MKIVHVSAYYSPHLGGMEEVVKQLATTQVALGDDVHIITSSVGAKGFLGDNKIRVDRLYAIEIAHTPIIPALFLRFFSMDKPDIVHIHVAQPFVPEICAIVCKLRKIPYVAHLHLDVSPSGKIGFLLPAYKKIMLGPVLRSASKVIVLNHQDGQLVKNKYKVSDLIEIPNGVRNEFFMKRKQRLVAKTVLFVGRISQQKRIERILEVARHTRSGIRYVIIGDGELIVELKNIAEGYGLHNIDFLGEVHGKKLLREYLKADLFLLLSEREGSPLVLLEAMACNLPIVGADAPGIKEMISGKGVIVNPDNTKYIAHTIEKLFDNVNARRKIANNQSFFVKNMTWLFVATRIKKVYEQVTHAAQ